MAVRASRCGLKRCRRTILRSATPIDDAHGLPFASRHRTGVQHFDANANAEVLAQHALDGVA